MFFFNDTATTELDALSLHDALPICGHGDRRLAGAQRPADVGVRRRRGRSAGRPAAAGVLAVHRGARPRVGPDDDGDRKSTRLNSSHANISYAVFCLKKKTNTYYEII